MPMSAGFESVPGSETLVSPARAASQVRYKAIVGAKAPHDLYIAVTSFAR